MHFWRSLSQGLRVLFSRDQADRDMDEELQHFLENAENAEAANGTAAGTAPRAVRLAWGSTTSIREEIRASGWEYHIGTLLADLRYAARGLRQRPGFTIVAALTLALGIGASTAIFSAVHPVLLAPLPYADAHRVVVLSDLGNDNQPIDVAYGTYHEVLQRSRSFSELAAADRWRPALTGLTEPERLGGALVTARYFRTMGVTPAVGRDFDASDDRPGAPRVAIVSDGFSRRRFAGPSDILGRTLDLDGNAYTVIGVMPAGFEDVLTARADVWAPRRYRDNASFMSGEWGHHMRMLGRLRPGVSLEQAHREVAAIGVAPSPAFPRPAWAAMANGLDIRALKSAVTRDVQPALLAIVAAVALVLVIAAVNVTNLLLARSAQRRSEIALRATLGADRRRIVRQLLTESVLLALLGGSLGVLVAALSVRAIVTLAPADLPRAAAIRLDGSALLFALMVTALVGIAIGLVPALRSTRRNLHDEIRSGSRTTAGAHHGLRRGLVITEVSLALIVLVGAGLMVRSLSRLFATAPGFTPERVLTMQVDASSRRYDSDAARYQYFYRVLDAVRAVPGITSAAFTSQLPLSGDLDGYGVVLASRGVSDTNSAPAALRYAVTPDWFRTMGIPLLRGRLLDASDRSGAVEAIVVSESFARSAFGDADPIGQQIRIGPEVGDTTRPWDVIVGVVGDVKQQSLAFDAGAAFYVAMGQWPWVDNVQSLAVKSSVDPLTLIPAVERAIWSVDRNQPISRVATMEQLLARSESQRRFVLTVFAAFGLTALAMAAIGIFGLISGGVTERMAELGVRAALGASRAAIVVMVLRQGLGLTAAGVVIGIAGAGAASGMLRSMLYGISRADVATYAGAAAVVLLAALAAAAFPAWRAVRVDPVTALRT